MSSSNRKALKSGIWYTLSNFFVRGIGLITTPIFTRLLTKAEFGAYNNYTSWLAIITILVTLNLESTLISARFDYKKKFDEYIFSILTLSTLSVAIWFIVLNVFTSKVELILGIQKPYINAMLLYLMCLPAINLFQARERYYYEYKKTVLISLILSVGTACISVLLVLVMKNRLAGRILGSIIPTVVIGSLLYLFFIHKGKKVSLKYWKYALPICLPYIPHLLSMTLLNSTDRIMIEHWCGSEATALYSIAYNCGSLVTLFLTSLNNAYSPWLGEKLADNKLDEIRTFSKKYISFFVYLAVGMMLVAPEVLLILGGASYYEAIYVMSPVAMGCICQFLYTLFVNIEQFKKKTMSMALASAIAAMINLGLNWLFIPQIGYLVAAYTTLIGYLCLLAMHMYLVYRLRLNHAYSYKFIAGIVVTGLCAMVGITITYSNRIARYIVILIYGLFFLLLIIKNKSTVNSLIRKIKQK